MKRILTLTLSVTTLVGLGACSSDTKSSVGNATVSSTLTAPSDQTLPSDMTLPTDLTLPSDLSVPSNLTSECAAVAMSFAGMMSQVFMPNAQGADVEKVFGDVSSKVPDDLKDDVAVMAAAFEQYGKIIKDSGNDMTNPAVQQALEDLGTPEVQAASDNIQAYFDATCPEG